MKHWYWVVTSALLVGSAGCVESADSDPEGTESEEVVSEAEQAVVTNKACVDWSCDGGGSCSFNAGCSTASPYVWKYNFTWGDGGTTGLTGSAVQSHTYAPGTLEVTMNLGIFFFSDPGSRSVNCVIHPRVPPFGPPPPPAYYAGRCEH